MQSLTNITGSYVQGYIWGKKSLKKSCDYKYFDMQNAMIVSI